MGVPVHINIEEIRKPELDAMLVAQSVAQQLERRVMFRRAMKRAVQNAMRIGAKGITIQVSGRMGGAGIARTEWYRERSEERRGGNECVRRSKSQWCPCH